MTALVAGGAGVFTHGASDLKASSRANIRRGLAASAALHLLLLAILLRATGGGDAVTRTYLRTTDVLLEPLRPLPPCAITPETATPPARIQPEDGTFEPKIMPPELPKDFVLPARPSREPFPEGEPGPSRGAKGIAAPGVTPAPPQDIYEVVDQPPVPIFAPTPVYPTWAREAGVTGQVLLNVLVGKDGRVRRVVIEKNVHGLGEAAREALARWTFRPARMNGTPVSTWVAIPVRFEL